MTRLVAISDLHFDATTLGVARFDEVRAAVDESVAYALKMKADAWLCLGDIADPDGGGASIRAMECTIETALVLAKANIPSVWIAGNHCCMEDGSAATVLSPLSALTRSPQFAGLIHVAEQPRLIRLSERVVVLCLPYAPASHSYVPGAEVDRLLVTVPETDTIIVVSHLTQVPGLQPGDEVEMIRGRDMPFPFEQTKRAAVRLQGHFHMRQVYDPKDGGAPIHVVGSVARYTFGEADHEPAYLVLEL